MAVNFTPQQQKAITATGGQLIVSAAAGSGKTAVLVERVMQILESGKADISKLLVVTFTEAAAAEMKNKMTKQLLARLRENPKNALLRRQLSLMPSARVQTVHSFCNSLIRAEFVRCGVSYDFSLLDETEAEVLFEQAMDTVFEKQYETYGSDRDFTAFFDHFSNERGDRQLRNIVAELYKKLRSHPDPDTWCRYTADTAEMTEGQKPEEQNWGRYVLDLCQRLHSHGLKNLQLAYEELLQVPEVAAKYDAAYESALAYGQSIEQGFSQGWDEAFDALHAFEKVKFSPCRYEDKAFTDKMRKRHERYVKTLEKICTTYMPLKTQYIIEESRTTAPVVRAICHMVMAFTAEFTRLKRESNALDFSDLEHLTLGLLQNEQGEPTEIAQKLSGELYELLVDEFQDTNEIQDRIFRAITPKTGNVFFVGDVKQSIYKFRLANPVIFVDKYKSAQEFDKAQDAKNRRIDLNKNFRSRAEVLGCTNFVFSRMMSEEFGDITYDDTQALHTGAQYSGQVPSEFYLIDMAEQGAEEESGRQIEAEAVFTAKKIDQMLQEFTIENPDNGSGRKAQPEDFAILLSSYSSKCGYFEKELAKLGIPVATAKKEGFGKTAEIAAVRGFLSVVDNPFQDIPMVAVMGLPFYSFTADDMIRVRLAMPEGSLYEGLCNLAEQGDVKCQIVVQDILRYAEYSRNQNVAQLIETFYREKQVVEVFCQMPGGESRRDNLENLLTIAESYEKSGTKGLFRFLNYLERRFDSGKDESMGGSGKGVQIMSIHKSKGLEFPVVFLPDLSKQFNTDDLKKPVLFHEDLQIGIQYRSFDTKRVYKSQMYSAVAAKLKTELAAEEMRKLYVAMTRAKEKLILIASVKNAETTINSWAESFATGFEPGAVASSSNFAYWLGGAFLTHKNGGELRKYLTSPLPLSIVEGTAMVFGVLPPEFAIEVDAEVIVTEQPKEVVKKAEFKPYLWEELTKIPSKLSPTGIVQVKEQTVPKAKEQFTRSDGGGAEKGTALHRCMEQVDFTRCTDREATAACIAQLYETGVLPLEEQKLVEPEKIYGFVQWFQQHLIQAKAVLREQQFAALFTPEELFGYGGTEDHVVVNGVIDLLILSEQGIYIVDYKSDYIATTPEETAEKHRQQVEIYAQAAEKLYGLPVLEKYVYLFRADKAVPLGMAKGNQAE